MSGRQYSRALSVDVLVGVRALVVCFCVSGSIWEFLGLVFGVSKVH